MQTYGYARVSEKEPSSDRQFQALRQAGVPPSQILTDKISGKESQCPQYERLLKKIMPSDRLVIQSIDKLGYNCREIMEQWQFITKDLRADISVLDMPLLDTSSNGIVSDVVLQVLSFVAENDRETRHLRQSEGISEAKRRGIKFGRPKRKRTLEYDKVKKDYEDGKFNSRYAAELLNVSQGTFLNWVKYDCNVQSVK